ncbi:MAG TPA: glycoside hydrolase [Cyanobacteria bacterium UBA11369]|nr:glycoside hydrolase [Cyanobacteria bacterium UBA11369]
MNAYGNVPASLTEELGSVAPLTPVTDPGTDSLARTGVFVTVHGHFYQPPRENPYLDAIERQPSATPFHDWNERIHHECYRPNAFARILNEKGQLVGIVNNYEYMSFNIGPTLMSWLERYDVEVYQRILEADRKSAMRLDGHGNAIAQVYNHIIMPLANERDKYTQIRWGKADFRSRFGRDPEGMWLAEAAVDYPTLKALIAENIRFIVLAPSQALRCRPIATKEQPAPQWIEVGGSQIDPTRPYRCFLPGGDRTKDYIDIFFYDGPISRDLGFGDVLNSTHHLAGRLGGAIQANRTSQLIAVATDGETFGHHKREKERCLAYAFTQEFPQRGWNVTNYAHYLSMYTPTWEVELKPVTAWSCAHGVGRWQDDCGCGAEKGWHQKWRRPLRDSLNWLRDRLVEVYEQVGSNLLGDPWQARDEYINVIRDRSKANVESFLQRHCIEKLTPSAEIDALRLLEMQRHSLLMFTSCGWFFEELSRPEGVQILRYAARAIQLAGEVAGVQLEKEFIRQLSFAPTNVEQYKNGAEVYRHLVLSAQVSLKQVAAHYAISSLFTAYPTEHRVYCYTAEQIDYQLQSMGPLSLAVGQLRLVSEITWESEHVTFAVLHLGGWDFHCCIQPFAGRRAYSELKHELFEALQQAGAAQTILAMHRLFKDADGGATHPYSLQNLFAEERHRIMRLLSRETLKRLDQLYTQVYRDNYAVLMAFYRDELPVPPELQVAAEMALCHRALDAARSLERDMSEIDAGTEKGCIQLTELEAIAQEAKLFRCQLNIPEAKKTIERMILRSLWHLLHDSNPATLESDVQRIERTIEVAQKLNLGLSLDRAQEIYYSCLNHQIMPQYLQAGLSWSPAQGDVSCRVDLLQLRPLLRLAQKLAVDIDAWLNQLV